MDRRSFLRRGIAASVLAGTTGTWRSMAGVLAVTHQETATGGFDLVAVKGGEAAAMFDKGIEILGGIKTFVKAGQKVVVKPNIGWDASPARAANTNPELVARVVKHCLAAGAKEVHVFDHTCDDWQRCYANSGIERAAKDAGGKVAPGHSEGYYHEVSIPRGKKLRKAKVHELVLNADVFINLPVLKDHSSSRLTIAMKNLMGIVWDRGEWHRNDLHQCIADFATYRNPDLTIVDAYSVMKRNGPRGVSVDDVLMTKALLISRDMVAADAAAAKVFGMNPSDVRHITLAADAKVGRMDLEALNIKRISL